MDRYGYIGIETLLNFCENSKDHAVTPNDFMRMKRVRVPERKKGKWIYERLMSTTGGSYPVTRCSECQNALPFEWDANFCPNCGADMRGEGD